MKTVNTLLLTIFLLFTQATLANDSLIVSLREAVLNAQNERNLAGLQEARAKFERLLSITERAWLVQHYIAWTDYHLGIYYFGQEDNDKGNAGKHLDSAIEHLKKSKEENEEFAETHALLSACYGMKIGISPIKGMFLGPKSGGAISKALELEPGNPRVHLIDGIGKMNTPSMFGGGKDKAIVALGIADSLFQFYQTSDPLYPDWGHVEAKIWLAKIAMDQENPKKARKYLVAALEQEPENNWIRHQLMPKLEKMEALAEESK